MNLPKNVPGRTGLEMTKLGYRATRIWDGGSVADDWKACEAAKMDELPEEGESRTAFLLRFTDSHPGMNTDIVGTKSPEHLQQNVDATARGALAPDVYAKAKRRLPAS